MSHIEKIRKNFSAKIPDVDLGCDNGERTEGVAVEIKKPESKKFQCEKCGSGEGWLPRAPGISEDNLSEWRCVECRPPSTPSIVSKRCGAVADALKAEVDAMDAWKRLIESQTIVVACEQVACDECKASWVIERPTLGGKVERLCWCCQSPIDADAFDHAISTRPPWRDWSRRAGQGVRKKNGRENGSSEKICGERGRAPQGRQCFFGRSKNECAGG
jgi:hypothetical protein